MAPVSFVKVEDFLRTQGGVNFWQVPGRDLAQVWQVQQADGARRLRLQAFRSDGQLRQIEVGLARASDRAETPRARSAAIHDRRSLAGSRRCCRSHPWWPW